MEKDQAREERIMMEIVVDAYDAEERMMGWYYYLNDTLPYPFSAECTDEHPASPLQPGETVEVVEMPEVEYCRGEMMVTIRWQERTFAVPLAQLQPMDIDEEAQQAVEDWHYWAAQGYQF